MPFPAFTRGVLAASIVLTASGCASIISDSSYPVSVSSAPAGARYEVTNEDGRVVHSGVTPGMVTLDAGAGFFDGETYAVTYRKDGYGEQKSTIDSKVDGWYWGNLVFGGFLGMLIIDPATGAMYKLPKSTHTTLYPVAASATAQPVAVPMASSQQADGGGAGGMSQEQQLDELARTPGLSYEEYQRRYRIITGQQ